MALPTCSVRARPEHHQLLRRIGRALAAQPNFAEPLDALIGGVSGVSGVSQPNTAVDQRIEDIERRLKQVEGQAVLRGETLDVLLETQDVLQPIRERLDNAEEFLQRVMALTKNINDRVKALERPAEPKAAKATPRQSRPAAAGKRRSRTQAT
jgi:hypothetical protein